MFDLSSTKLLILGVVALLVVGPKDLPVLLKAIGKYVAIIRRQADEFRAQFNDAMRETELDKIKQDVEAMGRDLKNTVSDAESKFNAEIAQANASVEGAVNEISAPPPSTPIDAPVIPTFEAPPLPPPPAILADASPLAEPAPVREPVKTGA